MPSSSSCFWTTGVGAFVTVIVNWHEAGFPAASVALHVTVVPPTGNVLPLGGFDSSATAMAQGPTRRARGEAFYKYITDNLGAKHTIMIVPECGHNDRCMFTTNSVFPVIFPR